MKELKLFSTYTGYGGAEWALKKADIPFEVIGYSEIHKGQIKIYEQNFKDHKNYGNITDIDANNLPDFDIVTGGFPCQDVSIAGLRDLSKGRTKSIFKLLDIIKIKKPKYVLLENVEGILSMLDGELIKEIIRFLKKCGYAVSYKLLYSKNHGTPQNRPRVFIAAELGRDSFLFNPFPQKEELKLTVTDLLEKEVDKKYYLTQKQINRIIERSVKRNKPLGTRLNPTCATTLTTNDPNGNPCDSIYVNTITSGDYSHQCYHNQFIIHSKQPRTGKGSGGSGPLSRDDNIAYTIDTTNSQFIIKEGMIRVLTPKECFRLQGFFNDEINIKGFSDSSLYFSAGNGWDINLVSKIFTKWFKYK